MKKTILAITAIIALEHYGFCENASYNYDYSASNNTCERPAINLDTACISLSAEELAALTPKPFYITWNPFAGCPCGETGPEHTLLNEEEATQFFALRKTSLTELTALVNRPTSTDIEKGLNDLTPLVIKHYIPACTITYDAIKKLNATTAHENLHILKSCFSLLFLIGNIHGFDITKAAQSLLAKTKEIEDDEVQSLRLNLLSFLVKTDQENCLPLAQDELKTLTPSKSPAVLSEQALLLAVLADKNNADALAHVNKLLQQPINPADDTAVCFILSLARYLLLFTDSSCNDAIKATTLNLLKACTSNHTYECMNLKIALVEMLILSHYEQSYECAAVVVRDALSSEDRYTYQEGCWLLEFMMKKNVKTILLLMKEFMTLIKETEQDEHAWLLHDLEAAMNRKACEGCAFCTTHTKSPNLQYEMNFEFSENTDVDYFNYDPAEHKKTVELLTGRPSGLS